MPVSLNTWQLAGLAVATAMLWMLYVRHKDRHQPEPGRRLAQAFALGVGALALSLLGFRLLDALGVPDIGFSKGPWTACYCFGIVGPLEEGTKVLVAYLFVFRWREFDEPMDGFVYAAAIALGFASAENFYAESHDTWPYQLAHSVALPITHVLFSAIWGFGIGHARFSVSRPLARISWQAGSIALAMFVHGLYDFLIYAYQASLFTSGLALGLWIILIWRAQVLRQQALAREAKAEPRAPGTSPLDKS